MHTICINILFGEIMADIKTYETLINTHDGYRTDSIGIVLLNLQSLPYLSIGDQLFKKHLKRADQSAVVSSIWQKNVYVGPKPVLLQRNQIYLFEKEMILKMQQAFIIALVKESIRLNHKSIEIAIDCSCYDFNDQLNILSETFDDLSNNNTINYLSTINHYLSKIEVYFTKINPVPQERFNKLIKLSNDSSVQTVDNQKKGISQCH